MYFFVSITGLIAIDRMLFSLERFLFIDRRKRDLWFLILSLPIYFFMVFKEHFALFSFYIGVIMAGLTFFFVFLEKKLEKVFFDQRICVVDSLLLHLKSGNSIQKALKEIHLGFNFYEKLVFEPLKVIFDAHFRAKNFKFSFAHDYFQELHFILSSPSKISDQLVAFKQGIKVQNRFQTKTSNILRQVKAQFLVAALIYGLIFALSASYLNLYAHPYVVMGSLTLLMLGGYLIFKMGRKVKWTL